MMTTTRALVRPSSLFFAVCVLLVTVGFWTSRQHLQDVRVFHQQERQPHFTSTTSYSVNSTAATTSTSRTTVRTPSSLTVGTRGGNTTFHDAKNIYHYFGCTEIRKHMQVIRILGKGKHKIAYEVEIEQELDDRNTHTATPNSNTRILLRAVAKRCVTYHCIARQQVRKEAHLLKALYEQYSRNEEEEEEEEDGGRITKFYGDCSRPMMEGKGKKKSNYKASRFKNFGTQRLQKKHNINVTEYNAYIQQHLTNFNLGYTSLMELGRPLLPETIWYPDTIEERHCFAEHYFTPHDRADLIRIAQRYAWFPVERGGPLLLTHIGQTTSNIFPRQYILTGGNGVGDNRRTTLNHIDLDYVFSCPKFYGQRNSKGNNEGTTTNTTRTRTNNTNTMTTNCTVAKVLEVNCQVISKLLNVPTLKCALDADPHPNKNTTTMTQRPDPRRRITGTQAALLCKEKLGTTRTTNRTTINKDEERRPRFFWT